MTLSNVERQVLALICDEHRQTRRGAKIAIIYAGMGATTYQQKARIVDVLHSLKNRGRLLLRGGPDAWVPIGDCMSSPEAPKPFTVERIGAPLPDELLNRCAAMNAALLAQAEKAYDAGHSGACQDLAWLLETGKQLVAAGGES